MTGVILLCLQKTLSLPMAVMVMLVLVMMEMDCSQAIPGTYITTMVLTNKWLPVPLDRSLIITKDDCEEYCIKHPLCDSYAVSLFERKCRIYDTATAGVPVKNNGYSIYIKLKTEEEGYYIYGTNYIRLVLERMNSQDGASACAEEKGILLPVRNDEIEKIMYNIMEGCNVWRALIGVTDEKEEGKWIYADGGPATYTNWHWKGVWPRYDLNCAVAVIVEQEVQWKHVSCWEKHYFFCQIPMF